MTYNQRTLCNSSFMTSAIIKNSRYMSAHKIEHNTKGREHAYSC